MLNVFWLLNLRLTIKSEIIRARNRFQGRRILFAGRRSQPGAGRTKVGHHGNRGQHQMGPNGDHKEQGVSNI